MEIIFIEEKSKLFGSTPYIGIGKRKEKLIFGEQAKKLRENASLSIEELAKEFDVRTNIINKIESQSMAFEEKLMKKYLDKFNIEKEYFFDRDLETLILTSDGHIIKSFETSAECLEKYNEIKEDYFNALENKEKYIIVDFTK